MHYRIGTGREITPVKGKFPPAVITHLQCCIGILDDAYGADRDYLLSGGYAVIVETADDLPYVRETLDLDKHPCEWVQRVGSGHLSALYLLNDDYAVVVLLPLELAPTTLQKQLEV